SRNAASSDCAPKTSRIPCSNTARYSMRELMTQTVSWGIVSTVGTGIGHTLADHTTLRLGGPATRFVVADSAADASHTVATADAQGAELLVLGGGSNLVVADGGVDGTVLRMANRGMEFTRSGEDVIADLAAGEDWDDVVARTVAEGFGGL